MAARPPRGHAARARNLVAPVATGFAGDPAGEAITAGVLAGITPGLSGRAGYVYETDSGSMERAFHGYAASPQPILHAKTFTRSSGTDAVFRNGPNDVSGTPSNDAGQVYMDARYRALAQRMMRS